MKHLIDSVAHARVLTMRMSLVLSSSPSLSLSLPPRYPLQLSEMDQKGYTFVRRRTKGNVSSYGFTSVEKGAGESEDMEGQDIELKRLITSREFRM